MFRILLFPTQVYKNTSNVDEYLVDSITMPAADPNAGEVYYRYVKDLFPIYTSFFPSHESIYIDALKKNSAEY